MAYRLVRLAGVLAAAVMAGPLIAGPALASQRQVVAGGPPGFYFVPPWRAAEVVRLHRDGAFQNVTALGRNDAWAVGQESGVGVNHTTITGGFVLHFNGKSWVRVAIPLSRFVPVSVSARGASGIWIFGYRPDATNISASPAYALVLRDGHWRVLPLPSGPDISWLFLNDLQSAVVSFDEVWVIGTSANADAANVRSVLWLWNGSTWSANPLPVPGAQSISAVPGAAWATTVADTHRTTAWQWNGAVWVRRALPYVTDGTVAAYSADKAWITGSGPLRSTTTYLLTWNGRRWRRAQTPVPGNYGAATSDGHGGVWFGQWAHLFRGKWYEPSAQPSWPGCAATGADAVVTPVPGTAALWLVNSCLTKRSTHIKPVIGLTGRL